MNTLSKSLKYTLLAAVIAGCAASEPSMKVGGEDFTNMDVADAATASKSTGIKLTSVDFDKKENTIGRVVVSLSDTSAFELKQSTPTEYALVIPGAKALEDTKEPQIALAGMPGIRTVRVTESGPNVLVRMFVDTGISLLAKVEGRNIVISAYNLTESLNSNARGQLAEEATKAADVSPFGEGKRGPDIPAADGSKIYTGSLISIDLQDADIDNALRIIAEVSHLNIIASEEVRGKVTLRLVDVPWDQALDVILKTNGLDQVSEGSVIRIAPVGKLRAEREALLEAKKAAIQLEELQVNYFRISYARATDLIDQVQSVLSERGSLAVDDRTNQLIVKDILDGQKKAEYLVRKLDLRTPQILLETQIVESQRNLFREFGNMMSFGKRGSGNVYHPVTGRLLKGWQTGDAPIRDLNDPAKLLNPGYVSNNPAAAAINGGAGFNYAIEIARGHFNIHNAISAFETEGKAKVISRPQIATVNNKPAEIKSIRVLHIRNFSGGTTVVTGGGSNAGGSGLDTVNVGITLTVTPQASPDYYVLLDINAKSSTLAPRSDYSVVDTVEREATSTVLIESGSTFALGGVYRLESNDDNQGVPFFKDIPVIGWLFRNQSTKHVDEELIFFLTPHIVEGSFDEDAMKITK